MAQSWFEANAPGKRNWFEENAPDREPPLTRERRAPGAPSALDAGHHPDMEADRAARTAEQISPFGLALGEAGEEFGRFSNDHLPEIAATAAALLTGGASVPAMLGAAGWSALAGGAAAPVREGIRRVVGEGRPMTGEELGLDVLREATQQGGSQLVGGALARGASAALEGAAPLARKGAERFAAKALDVSDKLARKSPGVNIPLEAARVGARISPKGERALSTDIAVLKDRATNAIGESDALIRPSEATAPAQALLRDRQTLGAVAADDVLAIEDEIARFIGDDAAISPEKMHAIKKWLAERARFGAAQVPARAEAQQALTRGAREVVGRAVPEAGAAHAEMSKLIPLRAAVQAAAQRNATAAGGGLRIGAGGALGAMGGALTGDPTTIGLTGLAGAVLPRVLASPNNQMRAASGLYRAGQAMRPLASAADPVRRVGGQVLPPSFRAALLAALDEDAGPLDNAGQPIAGASTVRP
jgi:hypothetical protein